MKRTSLSPEDRGAWGCCSPTSLRHEGLASPFQLDREELERAANQLRQVTSDVLAIEADMTMREEVETAVSKVRGQFGPVDVLVNNAGTISVGPMEAMTIDDYRTSINTHFWGPYFATTAVLPEMQKRTAGRIVNISSIGGKISVPHLLPYSVVAQQTGHTSTIFSYLVSKLSGRMRVSLTTEIKFAPQPVGEARAWGCTPAPAALPIFMPQLIPSELSQYSFHALR